MLAQPLSLEAEPEPYRFTIIEWHRLGEAGLFEESDRVELLDGEIIIMSPIGDRHAFAMSFVTELFVEQGRRRFRIWPANPIEADNRSEPLPDLSLVPRTRSRSKGHPFSHETYLVVEVADSSLGYDRGRKLRKYASTGVQEYWIVNLKTDVIEVYRRPEGDGYREKKVLGLGESISPQAFPDIVIEVEAIIPPR